MKNSRFRLTLITLMIVMVAAACSPSVQPAVPTLDPQALQQTADVLSTQVAATIVSGLTATAAANPTATPTATATETATPTDTQQPSITPPPLVMATSTPVPTRIILPTITSTPGEFQCAVTKQHLPAGTELSPGVDFDGRWTVKNTGTEDWPSGMADYQYISGEELHVGKDTYDLDTAVDTGDTVDIIVDMVAPKKAGRYTAQWAVTRNGDVMCYLPVDITVK